VNKLRGAGPGSAWLESGLDTRSLGYAEDKRGIMDEKKERKKEEDAVDGGYPVVKGMDKAGQPMRKTAIGVG
jgi:hypothetical protein